MVARVFNPSAQEAETGVLGQPGGKDVSKNVRNQCHFQFLFFLSSSYGEHKLNCQELEAGRERAQCWWHGNKHNKYLSNLAPITRQLVTP